MAHVPPVRSTRQGPGGLWPPEALAAPGVDRSELIEAGAHLSLSALERLPHRAADYDLLRDLMSGKERNLFRAAQSAGVTLTTGAWKIIAISLLADPAPLATRDLRSLAMWRRTLAGPPDSVLGAGIALLGLLEALEADAFGADDAVSTCRVACVLAIAAREGGRPEEAYDLLVLGLSVGAPVGAVTLPAARLALELALRHHDGSVVGICAVEVALACAAIAAADGRAERAALEAWDFARTALPAIDGAVRATVVARLASAAHERAFLRTRLAALAG